MDLIAIGEEANAMDAEIIARMNEVFSRQSRLRALFRVALLTATVLAAPCAAAQPTPSAPPAVGGRVSPRQRRTILHIHRRFPVEGFAEAANRRRNGLSNDPVGLRPFPAWCGCRFRLWRCARITPMRANIVGPAHPDQLIRRGQQ